MNAYAETTDILAAAADRSEDPTDGVIPVTYRLDRDDRARAALLLADAEALLWAAGYTLLTPLPEPRED